MCILYNFYFKGGWWYITFWELYIQIIDKYIWIFLATLHFNLYKVDREVDVYVSIFPLFAFTYSFCVCCVLLINFRIPIDCSGLSVWLSDVFNFTLLYWGTFFLAEVLWALFSNLCSLFLMQIQGKHSWWYEKLWKSWCLLTEQSENSYKWEICVLLSLHFPSLCRTCCIFHVSIELEFSTKHIAFLETVWDSWQNIKDDQVIRKIFHSNWNRLIKGLMFAQQLDRKWTKKNSCFIRECIQLL